MRAYGLHFFSSLCAMSLVHCGSEPSGFANTPEVRGEEPFGPAQPIAPTASGDRCKIPAAQSNAATECTKRAPPNAFTPVRKWSWRAPADPEVSNNFTGSLVIPLVANLTDDNGDGSIDLCDVPDVLVTVGGGGLPGQIVRGKIYMLSGKDGTLEGEFDGLIDPNVTPALGDIDGDGLIEVVTHTYDGYLVIYEGNTGRIRWVSKQRGQYLESANSYCHAIALYDLDGDGFSEIISGFEVLDHTGAPKFKHNVREHAGPNLGIGGKYWCPANIAADLDGDGMLEVILGNTTYRADGTQLWSIPGPPGQPMVANLDADPEPEIVLARQDGLLVLEHTGAVKWGPFKPAGEKDNPNCLAKPGAIHDLDGDGRADIATSSCTQYGVYRMGALGPILNWSVPVNDVSGIAASTAFDFLGGGVAQAVYGDQETLLVMDGKTGAVNLREPRTSGTLIEYPVVADVDNDQSADILVVSNSGFSGTFSNTLDVWQDAERRWIPTRRIWNQHAYHVTNVREDGSIPRKVDKSWLTLNTFRTNAQLQDGQNCIPALPR